MFSSSTNNVYKYQIDNFNTEKPNFSIIRVNIHQKRITHTFFQSGILNFIDEDNNLFLFDLKHNTKVYIRNITELMEKYGTLKGIVSFFDDIIIAFKENGLIKLEGDNHYHETVIDRSIRIFSIYRDPTQDIIWVATDGQGVITYSKKHSIASHIMLRDFQGKITRQIRSLYTDKDSCLWFGTKGDGLICIKNYKSFNPENALQSTYIYFPDTKQLVKQYNRPFSEFQIFGITPSRYMNGFWLCAAGNPALSYYDYNDDKVKSVSGETGSLKMLHCLYEENDSTLWISSSGAGLCKVFIHRSKKNIVVSQVKQFVFKTGQNEICDFFSMIHQGDSVLWLGSRGMGLVRFNIKNGVHTVFQVGNNNNPALNDILAIHDYKGILYLGTSAGLVRFELDNTDKPIISYINRQQGLINDMIHGILEDDNGYLWLSTSKGLIKYNPQKNVFHTYYFSNGLQISEFSDDAYYKCPYTGSLFFGGVSGLLYLEQEQVKQLDYYPELQVRKLTLDMQNVNFYDYYNESKNLLTLKGSKITFSISFIAPDYLGNEYFEYSYALIPKDGQEKWSSFSSENNPVFQSVSHGDYTLKVRYKKDLLDTEYKTYFLNIHILPPWYMTDWAYLVYIAIAIIFFIYMIHFWGEIKNKERMKKLMIYENSNATSRNLYTHFLEVSDSFSTIYWMCKQLRSYKKMPAEYYKMLDVIHDKTASFSFVFNKQLAGNSQYPIEYILPTELPIYNEINPEQVSTKIINILIQQGFHNFSAKELNIDNKPIFLSKIGLEIILYYIYSQSMNDKSHFRLLLKGEVNNNNLILQMTLPKQNIDLFLQNLPESKHTGFYDLFYYQLFCNAINKMKGKVTSSTNGVIIVLPGQPPQKDVATTDKKRKTILFLENNDEMRWLISLILSTDYSIIHAKTIKEAFDNLEKHDPDIFLADIQHYVDKETELIKLFLTNKKLLIKTTFVPMINWKIDLINEEELYQLTNAFIFMPYNILFIKEILDIAASISLNKTKIIVDIPGENTNGFICDTPEKAKFATRFIQILEEHLSEEELSVPFIANKLSMSPRQYYRRFKEISNLSPGDFIKGFRLERAAYLLRTTDWPIQKIIIEVGFRSRSYFYKEFIARFGITPKSQQQQNSDDNE